MSFPEILIKQEDIYSKIINKSSKIKRIKRQISSGYWVSPALKVVQGWVGRSFIIPVIQSYCGCAFKKALALNGIPHEEPHLATNDICFAIFESRTFPSRAPSGVNGRYGPDLSSSRSQC